MVILIKLFFAPAHQSAASISIESMSDELVSGQIDTTLHGLAWTILIKGSNPAYDKAILMVPFTRISLDGVILRKRVIMESIYYTLPN